jgi:sec-independent protein translocase protein TatC
MDVIKKNKQALAFDFLPFFLELRLRLLYCIVVFIGTVCLLLPFSHYLYRGLAQPLLQQLPANSRLLSTTLTAPLFVPLKCTIMFAIFVSMPFMIYQFWRFVAPALYLREQRLLWLILLLSSGLFYSGVFFFYQFILPVLIAFFITTSPSYVYIVPDIGHYLDLTLQLLIDFGLIFEMPLLVIIAVSSGVLTIKTLSGWRRYFIVLSFIIAMFLTPPDIVSQTLLALPLCLLFEMGLFICRFIPEKHVKALQ